MTPVSRSKNLVTRLQVLVKIAVNQPYIQQKDIARKIRIKAKYLYGVTQAVIEATRSGLLLLSVPVVNHRLCCTA